MLNQFDLILYIHLYDKCLYIIDAQLTCLSKLGGLVRDEN